MYTTVALAINNLCNMRCVHCYLNLDDERNIISEDVLTHLLRREFLRGIRRVVIVGKEPLYNNASRRLVARILDALDPMGIDLEIITNGLNLHLLDPEVARRLAAIDVSLDGGPRTYAQYRGQVTMGQSPDAIYPRITESVQSLRGAPVNILNTLSSVVTDVEDMMQIAEAGPAKILFSPYVLTDDVTDPLSVRELPMGDMLQLLARSPSFIENPTAMFVLGTHSSRGMTREELKVLVDEYGLRGKVRWIGSSDTFVRIAHNGLVTDSATALIPSSYAKKGVKCLVLDSIQDFKSSV